MEWKKPKIEVIACGMEIGAYRSPSLPLDEPDPSTPTPRLPRADSALERTRRS